VTPGSESAPGGGSIAHQRHRRFGIGVAGQFPLATSGASAPARSVCSVMWGSASADRSITASGSLPRTPSPAFGLGPRLFRARHRGSSESPMTRSGPAGTIQPDGADPAIEVGPVALRSVGPSPSGPGRPGSSEPRATKPPRLFGAPATAPGTRRRSSSEPRPPLSPRVRTPGSSESGRPLPARRNHPLQRGRLSTALRNGGSSSRDTVAPALRSPARPGRRGSSELQRPSHGTRRRSSSEPRPPPSQDPAPRLFGARWPRPQGSASPPFGARSSPSPGWTFGRTPPAPAGIAVGAVTGFGRRPTPGRTVTTGRQRDAVMRFRLLTRGTLRRVRIAPRELIPAAGRLRATSCRHA